MTMTKEEILKDFQEAKDQRAQVRILADLNLCKPEDIIDILKEMGEDGRQFNGWTPRKPKAPKVNDVINHPSHYTSGKIEVIDFIEDQKLGYHLGNAVKYISRAGKKDPTKTVEDLRKAAWYINREIERLEKEEIA